MTNKRNKDAMNCQPGRDFLRHIVNHVLSDIAEKIPMSVFNEIRSRFAKAEETFRFTKFGGNPERLKDYLESEEFQDLVSYARAMNVEWVIQKILEATVNEYKDICPVVAEKAKEVLEYLKKTESEAERPKLSPDVVYRMFKMKGYKVTMRDDGVVFVEGSNFTVSLKVSDSTITYTICREGKATNIGSIEAKIEKIREL
ncbi:MAG: hypothetical protein F7C82_06530 [Desulfurococcales archaeon]|nr:hypothetical protein [Desulfurococcales archaeon]MCE4626282.1 hypothetical protein [Desulfurococcales archaeon]MCE4629918.1 hypothetical protein [Desulfurococcales archaeon]